MRWDRLFEEFDARLADAVAGDEATLEADDAEHRAGRAALEHRLTELASVPAEHGSLVDITTRAGHRLRVRIVRVGQGWVTGVLADALREPAVLIPLVSVALLRMSRDLYISTRDSLHPPVRPDPAPRVGLAVLLRDLERRRLPVQLITTSGRHHGRIIRVGRDHIDLIEEDQGASAPGYTVVVIALDGLDHLRY